MAKRVIHVQPPPEPRWQEVWLNKATAAAFTLGAVAGALVALLA